MRCVVPEDSDHDCDNLHAGAHFGLNLLLAQLYLVGTVLPAVHGALFTVSAGVLSGSLAGSLLVVVLIFVHAPTPAGLVECPRVGLQQPVHDCVR